MDRRILVLMFAVLVWARGAEAAAAGACAPYTKPIVVDFTTHASDPLYNHNLNVAGIRNLFRTRGQASGGPHDRALGITYVETMLSMNASSTLVPHQDGYCIYLNSVTANFGWERLEVFIASELVQGGCAYRAVLDHENQHVGINRDTLKEFAPQIRARLEDVLRDQQPVLMRDNGQGTDAILAQIHARMNAILDQFRDTLGRRQATIDTARNYGATSALCSDWGDAPRTR